MMSRKLSQALILAALTATLGTAALANNHTGGTHRFGNATPDSAAQRTITLRPDSKYANIEQGEIVKFVTAGKTFTWNFDTFDTRAFELAKIAPKDTNVGDVVVFVRRNRLYTGGSQ